MPNKASKKSKRLNSDAAFFQKLWTSVSACCDVEREMRSRAGSQPRELYLDTYLRKMTAVVAEAVAHGIITAFRGDRILAARTIEVNELKRLRGEQPYMCRYNQTTAVEMRLSA
jgi:hypothetical protein